MPKKPTQMRPATLVKHQNLATARGLTMMRPHETKNLKWHYILPCGHEGEFYPQQVQDGAAIVCKECGHTAETWTQDAKSPLVNPHLPPTQVRIATLEQDVASLTSELLSAADVIRAMDARITALEGGTR